MRFPRRLGLVNWSEVRRRAQVMLRKVGIDLDPDARVFELSRTEKVRLAIARAVAVEAEVLVLDEPTASLPADDVHHLFEVRCNKLRAKRVGMIFYVTHRLDEVIEIADEICVMRDGRYIAAGPPRNTPCATWCNSIAGEEKRSDMRKPPCRRRSIRYSRLKTWSSAIPARFASSCTAAKWWRWPVCAARVRRKIGRALFGMRTLDSGLVILFGKRLEVGSLMEAIAAGISLVAGDRLGESVVPTMSARENLFINPFNIGKAAARAVSRERRGASRSPGQAV